MEEALAESLLADSAPTLSHDCASRNIGVFFWSQVVSASLTFTMLGVRGISIGKGVVVVAGVVVDVVASVVLAAQAAKVTGSVCVHVVFCGGIVCAFSERGTTRLRNALATINLCIRALWPTLRAVQ